MSNPSRAIALIGGGRWARVILGCIRRIKPLAPIIWVTKYGRDTGHAWLKTQDLDNVSFVDDLQTLWPLRPRAVIIASTSSLHADHLRQSLANGIPTLCEKPYCFTLSEADELISLSQHAGIIGAVNLEFSYATYFKDFAKLISDIEIQHLGITWSDPWMETRYDETKCADIYTSMAHDAPPHCWSAICAVTGFSDYENIRISYTKTGDINIRADVNNIPINMDISRRAKTRVRRMTINQGRAQLNFAQEPGAAIINGKQTPLEWRESRPLTASLAAFFHCIENQYDDLPTSLEASRACIALSADAHTGLIEQFSKRYEELKSYGRLSPDDISTQKLAVDWCVPILSAKGERVRAHTKDEMRKFAVRVFKEKLWPIASS